MGGKEVPQQRKDSTGRFGDVIGGLTDFAGTAMAAAGALAG